MQQDIFEIVPEDVSGDLIYWLYRKDDQRKKRMLRKEFPQLMFGAQIISGHQAVIMALLKFHQIPTAPKIIPAIIPPRMATGDVYFLVTEYML